MPVGARSAGVAGRERPIDLFDGCDAATATPTPLAPAADPLAGVPLMQVFDTYILYRAEQGVVIVDQHSAHERVLYEAVMRELSGQGAAAQRLLLPVTVELTDEELRRRRGARRAC